MHVTVVSPKNKFKMFDLSELWMYRDLLYFFVTRDIKVRYRQTVLGGMWAIIQPLLTMVVFSIFFGRLAKIASDGVPYPIFSYTGLVAWYYFSNALTLSSGSLVGSANLISKVYFPRIFVPISMTVSGLLDFAVSFSFLLVMLAFYKYYISVKILFAGLCLFSLFLAASGAGVFLAALSVKYRDIKFAIPFIIQFWMFASPIAYPTSLVPERYRQLYAINPVVGVVEGFRSALLTDGPLPYDLVAFSFLVSMILFFGGMLYFKQVERFFADVI